MFLRSGGVAMEGDPQQYVLEMRGITKRFPGVLALDRINLKVRPASVHALVGENGAGKSTLMNVLSGGYSIDGGEIFFKGRRLDHGDITAVLQSGISMVRQELSPVLDMTVAENVFLGREPMRGPFSAIVDSDKMYADTQALLDRLGLRMSARGIMRDFSIASMQLIEIAKAISREASLVIMDEPTSAISEREVSMLFRQISDLKKRGAAIIYITHKMDEIFQIADDITVIRDGRCVASNSASEYDENKLIAQMVGRTISNIFPKEDVPIGEEVFAVEKITKNGAFRDVSFSVRKGEVLGMAGLIGAGRTEVARAIFGLDPIDSGEIRLSGEPIDIATPADAIRMGIAMVSEDRKAEGLVLCRSVGENISLANLNRFTDRLFIDEKSERAEIGRMIQLLRIKTPGVSTIVETLSGGNQQKLVIAKWLLGNIKLLILDEPTRGIDIGSKSEIHRLIVKLARDGVAIIMISSELPEILAMSDKIVVMKRGIVAGELRRREATQENLMRLSAGVSV
jgi:inositol transport system ATP-binding protein